MYIVINLKPADVFDVADICKLIDTMPVEAGFGWYQLADLPPQQVLILCAGNTSPEVSELFLERMTDILGAYSLRIVPKDQSDECLTWHYGTVR